jgi:CBS domain-containing protein
MRCADAMRRRLAVLGPERTVLEAARMMREFGCGVLPVVDADRRVLGMLTDRDIVLRVCAAGAALENTLVSAVMSREVVSCNAGDSLQAAQELMILHQKQRLPVLEGGKLVGVLSLTDIAHVEEPMRVARLLREITARELRIEHP